MRRAVLFKSFSENYQNAFQSIGIQTIFIETLQFKFTNLSSLEKRLCCTDYDGLILTSPRAIEAVSKCLKKDNIWNNRKIYAVGESSGNHIKELLNLSASGLESGNSENLAEIISKENSTGAKFLFPCGNLKTENVITKLKEKGILVDAITVYETEENDNLKPGLGNLVKENSKLMLVFFSPSGVQCVFNNLKYLNFDKTSLMYFAIGKTTCKKLEDMGVKVNGIAKKPTAESLTEVIHSVIGKS